MKLYMSLVLAFFVMAANFSQIRCQESFGSISPEAYEQCSNKHEISDEAYQKIVSYESVPDDLAVKCWLSCLAKESGMIKGGEIDWEHNSSVAKSSLTKAEDLAKVDKIATLCRDEVKIDKDQCQLAYNVAVCKIKYWNEFGLPKLSE